MNDSRKPYHGCRCEARNKWTDDWQRVGRKRVRRSFSWEVAYFFLFECTGNAEHLLIGTNNKTIVLGVPVIACYPHYMPQSLCSVHIELVFATQYGADWRRPGAERSHILSHPIGEQQILKKEVPSKTQHNMEPTYKPCSVQMAEQRVCIPKCLSFCYHLKSKCT